MIATVTETEVPIRSHNDCFRQSFTIAHPIIPLVVSPITLFISSIIIFQLAIAIPLVFLCLYLAIYELSCDVVQAR